MEVILMEDVDRVGHEGDILKVADGYARNYLFPRKLAVAATDGAVRQAQAIKQAVVRREAKTRAEAQELAKIIEQVTLTFHAKAGEGDRLFGSITSADIVEALAREKGITVDKRKIDLDSPLKELGTHQVAIKLHPEVSAKVAVVVEKDQV